MVTKNTTPGSESLGEIINRKDIPIDTSMGGLITPAVMSMLEGMKEQLEGILNPETPSPKSPSGDR